MKQVKRIQVTPTITLDAYTAGDVVGGLQTFAVSSVAPVHGYIRSLLITDDDSQAEQYTIYLYEEAPTTIANDAAFAPSVADLNKVIGTIVVATADWTADVGSTGIDWAMLGGHEDKEMWIPFFGKNVYAYLVATDTPDYAAADDLVLTMTVEYNI